MKNSWKLGEISGIGILVHWSFLILPVWITLSALSKGGGVAAAIGAVAFIFAVFGCVVLHELGHALMARRFGIGTRDITLLPIGGIARLERIPQRPVEELAVALAGPAVNVVIAASLLGGLILSGGLTSLDALYQLGSSFLVNLVWVNIALVASNLLPAFPLDGGRILRSLLAMQSPYVRATKIAATVGQVLAVGLAVLGFFTNWMLMLVALFVFMAARAEAEFVTARSLPQTRSTHPGVPTRIAVLSADARLRDIVSLLCGKQQEHYPVMRGRQVMGMVSKEGLMRAFCAGRGLSTVGDLALCEVPIIEAYDKLPPRTDP